MFESKIKDDVTNGINLFYFNRDTKRLEFRYTHEIKEQIENIYLKHFPNLNLNPATPQGQQITSLTESFNACIDYLESCGTSFFLGGEGLFLDYWAWYVFRLRRKQGKPSKVLIKISGVAETAIPADFQVSDGEHIYTIEKATKINNKGTIEAFFYETQISDFVAPAKSITQIVTIIEGVERVINESVAEQGFQRESDTELFARALMFGSTTKCGSFRSILANVAAVEGVTRVGGYENVLSQEVIFKGQPIPAHSFGVVVEGGADFDIIRAIAYAKGTGAGVIGDVEMEIWKDKEKYTYAFFRPQVVNLHMRVSALLAEHYDYERDTFDKVRQNIFKYLSEVKIGGLITQPNLVNASYEGFLKKDFIKDLKFSVLGNEMGYENLQLQFREIPYATLENIEVTI